MTSITQQQAETIVAAAIAKGRELRLNPLCVAVLDPGGHLISLSREDGASSLRPQMACGKAGGALSIGISSRKIAGMAAERPSFVASLGMIAPHGIIPAPGGVIVVDEQGAILGAVGITGDTADNDEIAAFAGVAAAGLRAQE